MTNPVGSSGLEGLSVDVVEGIRTLPRAEWEGLTGDGADATPFMGWCFLAALEEAQVLGPQRGWVPRFIVLRSGETLVGACPVYLKSHSHGEFVFDFAWADCATQLGVRYYPKLLVGVPFTPISGRRLLTHPSWSRPGLLKVLAHVLIDFCTSLEMSSVHVNFARDDEIDALVEAGFFERHDIQFHWFRRGEQDFDDYLARFKSKKRNQIKREIRALDGMDLLIENIRGHALDPAMASSAFEFYKATIDKLPWGRQYLNKPLFSLWCRDLKDQLEFATARNQSGAIVAGALNFSSPMRLYGRYWGCTEAYRHLHFNVCYYQGIRECFDRGLDAFEPGAQGPQKLIRGFEPTITKSAHFIRNDRLRQVIAAHVLREKSLMDEERTRLLEIMPTKNIC